MNPIYVRRIFGKFNKTKIVRLADLSGDTNWRKNKRFNTAGTSLLPYKYEAIDLKQRDIFRTAKELQLRGLIRILFKSGENWFLKTFATPDILDLTPILEVTT